MDANIARWAQVAHWEREDLDELHRLERWLREADDQGVLRFAKLNVSPSGQLDFWQNKNLKNGLVPYWDKKIPPEEIDMRMKMFERKIYPIWKPLLEREGDCLESLQKVDIEIWRAQLRPERDVNPYSAAVGRGRSGQQAFV